VVWTILISSRLCAVAIKREANVDSEAAPGRVKHRGKERRAVIVVHRVTECQSCCSCWTFLMRSIERNCNGSKRSWLRSSAK